MYIQKHDTSLNNSKENNSEKWKETEGEIKASFNIAVNICKYVQKWNLNLHTPPRLQPRTDEQQSYS